MLAVAPLETPVDGPLSSDLEHSSRHPLPIPVREDTVVLPLPLVRRVPAVLPSIHGNEDIVSADSDDSDEEYDERPTWKILNKALRG